MYEAVPILPHALQGSMRVLMGSHKGRRIQGHIMIVLPRVVEAQVNVQYRFDLERIQNVTMRYVVETPRCQAQTTSIDS
jgi:hypothetical protein